MTKTLAICVIRTCACSKSLRTERLYRRLFNHAREEAELGQNSLRDCRQNYTCAESVTHGHAALQNALREKQGTGFIDD